MINLDGKVALVTGGGAGIGRAVAETFAAAGATVVVAENDPARAAALRAALPAAGDHLVELADVTDAAQVAALMAIVEARFGRLNVLVNNVGDFLAIKKPFAEGLESEWDALYRVNLLHVFLVTRAAIPLLLAGGEGGSIVSISTIEAFRGIPCMAVYSAFKAAIGGFTRSLALELGPQGIRVNAIAPETTESAQVPAAASVPAEHREHIAHWFPIGRFGRPEDTAGSALFLASGLSSWMTGSTLHVDGGALAAAGYYRTLEGGWTHTPVISGHGMRPRLREDG